MVQPARLLVVAPALTSSTQSGLAPSLDSTSFTLNCATGAGTSMPVAARSSKVTTTGALVVDAARYARAPTPPATWRAAAELVWVYCQVEGSVPASAQARMRMVVGLVPWNWARTRMKAPGVRVRPVTRTSVPMAVSTLLTTAVAWTKTAPLVREAQLGPVLGGGVDAPGDAVDELVAADGGAIGRDPEAEIDVLGRDRREDGAAVGTGEHRHRARRAGDVEVGGVAGRGSRRHRSWHCPSC